MSALKNEIGFSLLEVVITLGLSGMISLLALGVYSNQKLKEQEIKALDEISFIINELESHLRKPDFCNTFLANRNVATHSVIDKLSYFQSGREFYFLDARPIENQGILPTGVQKINHQYVILKEGDIFLTPSVYGDKVLVLNIRFRPKTEFFLVPSSSRTINRKVYLTVARSPTDSQVVTSCKFLDQDKDQDQNSFIKEVIFNLVNKDLGRSFEGNVDFVTNKCPAGTVPVKINLYPKTLCKEITKQLDLNDIFDTTVSNCVAGSPLKIIKNANGKLQLVCSP